MRILAFVIPEKGHLNPLLPSLRKLAAGGHELVVAAARDLGPALASAGIAARTALIEAPAPPASFLTQGREFAERLRDPSWLAGWIEALLIDAVPAQLPSIEALLAREQPDVVISDPMLYAVAIACARAQLPWAALSSSLNPVTPPSWSSALTDTLERLRDQRAALFHAAGVAVPRFFVSDAESPWLNVAFTSQAYVPHAVDPAFALVGAPFDRDDVGTRGDETPFPWQRLLPGRRRLYCSFGSQAFYQPRLFARVFAAAQALGLQVVASVGDLIDEPAFVASAPEDAILVRYTPQLELLSQVDLVVSHGGANSVVESLAHGKPILLLTLCNDQPLQARFLEASGAGLSLDAAHGDVSPEALLAALRELGSAERSARARAIGESLREAGGPARVAQLVLSLAQTQRSASADASEGALEKASSARGQLAASRSA